MESRRLPIRRILCVLVVLGFIAWRVSVSLIDPKLEIGRETTYVTGPLTLDGCIDYPAALHQRLSEGVKPDDNAAVLLDRAFGPGAISPELRYRYFQWMATDPVPEQGDYVVAQSAVIENHRDGADASPEKSEAMSKEFQGIQQQSWTRADRPLAAEWLDLNAKPLELIEQATRRSQYYLPLVTSEGFAEQANALENLREAVRLLVARAMFRLGENDVVGAWSDLLGCHRLAQLVSQRAPTMNSFLVAVAMDGMTARGDAALIAHGLTLEQARKCLTDHVLLLPFAPLADVLDRGGRLGYLGKVLYEFPRSGFVIDANTMLRRGNHMYNDFIRAMKNDNFAERKQMLAGIENDLKQQIAVAQQPLRMAVGLAINPRQTISESVGDALFAHLMPALAQADSAQMRTHLRREFSQIGFALAAYHSEQGTYPRSLDELVPKYLTTLPLDKYNDKPLLYKPR